MFHLTANVYIMENSQDSNLDRLVAASGLLTAMLYSPWLSSVLLDTHSRCPSNAGWKGWAPMWKQHWSYSLLESQKSPLLEWNKNIQVIRCPLLLPLMSPPAFSRCLHFRTIKIVNVRWRGGRINRKTGRPFKTNLLTCIWVNTLPPGKDKFPTLCI